MRIRGEPRVMARALLLRASLLVLVPTTAWASSDGGTMDLVWRVVNLLILFVILYAFGRKPMRAYFADRRDRILGETQEAARLHKEAEERYIKWEHRLVDLDAELEKIRSVSAQRAAAERDRILADATAAGERIRNDARTAVEQELRRARAELREEAADLAIELAGGMLRAEVGEADRDRLIDEFISEVDRPRQGSGS